MMNGLYSVWTVSLQNGLANTISLMLYIGEIRLILSKLGLISVFKNELVNVVGYDIIR